LGRRKSGADGVRESESLPEIIAGRSSAMGICVSVKKRKWK
jgi:hypothetical protein